MACCGRNHRNRINVSRSNMFTKISLYLHFLILTVYFTLFLIHWQMLPALLIGTANSLCYEVKMGTWWQYLIACSRYLSCSSAKYTCHINGLQILDFTCLELQHICMLLGMIVSNINAETWFWILNHLLMVSFDLLSMLCGCKRKSLLLHSSQLVCALYSSLLFTILSPVNFPPGIVFDLSKFEAF